MANNGELNIKIIMSDNGNVAKITTNVVKATKATKDLNAAQAAGAKEANNHSRAINGGVASANNAGRSMSKLLDTVGGNNSGLVAAYATLATNAFAVSAAFNTLSNAAKAEQLLAGLEKQGARTGKTLTITAQNMKELSGNAISMADSMQSAAQMSAAGFSTDTMERLTKVATDAASALGRSVPDAMERIVKGTSKLEPELLDELGIMTKLDEATRLYATQIGKAPAQLSRFEKSQAFVNAVADEGERKFGGLSDSLGGLKAYDSLGAAFTDLSNSVLGFLNTALLPVANFLSNNSTVLLGVLVIFAGTIRNMILPALSDLAKSTAEEAAAAKKAASARKSDIETRMKEARAIAETAAAEARSFGIHQKSPKIFKDKAQAILAGSKSVEDYESAYNSMDKSIKKYESNITAGIYKDEQSKQAKKELVSELKAMKAVLLDVQLADKKAADASVDNSVRVRNAKRAEKDAILEATKKEGLSNVITSATEGDFVGAFDKLNESLVSYKEKTEEVSAGGAPLTSMFSDIKDSAMGVIGSFGGMITSVRQVGASSGILAGFRTGLLGVAGAARITGIALTNMIPIIGQIITVLGLLWSAISWIWEYSRPEGTEQLNKALEEQEERFASTAEAAKELKRQTMGSAEAQISSLTIVSNKVNELTEGYQAIRDAEANLGKKKGQATGLEDNTFNLKRLELDSSVTDTSAYKTLQNMQELGFESLTMSIYGQVRAQKALSDSAVSTAEKEKILGNIIKNAQKDFGDAGANATALKDSYTQLDKSVEEFNRTALTSTPFDAIVKNLTDTSMSIYSLQASMYRGAITAKDFGVQLASISDRSQGLLDVNIQSQVTEYKNAVAELGKLKAEAEKGQTSKLSQDRIRELEGTATAQGKITAMAKTLGPVLQQNLETIRKETSELQNQLRTNASLANAIKARADAAARNLDDTKMAAKVQDAANEAQVRLAVATLDAQIKYTTRQKKAAEDSKRTIEAELAGIAKTLIAEKARIEQAQKDKEKATKKELKGLETIRNMWRSIVGLGVVFKTITEEAVSWASDNIDKISKATEDFFNKVKDTAIGALFKDVQDTSIKVDVDVVSANNAYNELLAKQAELRRSLLTVTQQVVDLNSELSSFNNEKIAKLSTILSSAEKAGRDLKYDMELINEFLSSYTKISEAATTLDLERLKANKNTVNAYGQGLLLRQQQLAVEIRSITIAKEQEKNTLNAKKSAKELYLAQSGLAADVRAAAEFDLKLINTRLSAIDTETSALTQIASAKSAIQAMDEASLDIYKEGIEIQQRALEVMQKRFELQSRLIDQTSEINTLNAEIAAARTGQPISEKAKKSLELQSAEEAFQLAQNQLGIKLKGIELEYGLLEAQRLATLFEFKGRKELIAAQKSSLESQASLARAEGKEGLANILDEKVKDLSTTVTQFESTIVDLGKTSYKELLPMARKIEIQSVEILGKRAEKIRAELQNLGRQGTDADVYIQAVNNLSTILKSAERIMNPENLKLSDTVVPDAQKAAEAQFSQTQELIKSIDTNFPDLKKSLDSLAEMYKPLIGDAGLIEKALSQPLTPQLGTAGVQANIQNGRLAYPTSYGVSGGAGGAFGAGREGIRAHAGQDMGTPLNTSVISQLSGVVQVLSTDTKALGGLQMAIISKDKEGNNLIRLGYAHLNKIERSTGDIVNVGEEIAKTGASGRTAKGGKYAPHLHYTVSVWQGGKWTPVDPTKPLDVKLLDKLQSSSAAKAAAPSTAGTGAVATAANDNVSELVVNGVKPLVPEFDNLDEMTRKFDEYFSQIDFSKARISFAGLWDFATETSQPLLKTLKSIGPSGDAAAAAIEGLQAIGNVAISFSAINNQSFEQYKTQMAEKNKLLKAQGMEEQKVADEGQFRAQKLASGFAAAAAVIGSVMSILKASSDAKIAGIDKEIAAEQKRDGKSAASVDKLDALEKKKEAIAKKQFSLNKKLMLAQAVMSTAAGIAGALAAPFGLGIPLAILVGAMGAAQIALIAGTQYESSAAPKAVTMPSSLSIGKRSDTVNLAGGPSATAGGEVGYLRGAKGTGTNASNYRTVGSAYGGELMRGYGNRGFVVGEKGPEVITPDTPITVTPANDVGQAQSINASFNIQALDSQGVQEILVAQKGNIIKMLREAANNSGQSFLEGVNTNTYTRPQVGKL